MPHRLLPPSTIALYSVPVVVCSLFGNLRFAENKSRFGQSLPTGELACARASVLQKTNWRASYVSEFILRIDIGLKRGS